MRCPECGNKQFQDNGFETVCTRCGLVAEEERILADVTRFVKESAIDPRLSVAGGFGFKGRIVKSSWLFSRREKNLMYAKKQIELFANRLQLTPRIINDTFVLFSQVNNSGLLSGRTMDHFIVASLYHTCLVHGFPKTLVELSIFTGIPVKHIALAHKLIRNRIKLPAMSVATIDLIPKYGSDIGLSQKTITRAIELCGQFDKKLSNIPPRTKAVVFLYSASKELNDSKPQRLFTNATGVIERVIRAREKQLTQLRSNSS